MKNTTEEEKLIQFGISWDQAILSNDVSEISPFMSDDWVNVGSNGITTKETFLASIKSGSLTHHTMTTELPRAKIYNDTGIVTSRGISAGTWNGTPFELHEWQTSVYIRKVETWQCVLTMLTLTEQ
jgi:hypothetical protein